MNEFLQQLVGLCLIRLVLDGLLPEGDSASWANLGLELSMMLCVLYGLGRLLRLGI